VTEPVVTGIKILGSNGI